MNRRPIGLPLWTPIFILFLLFLASVWVVVNRQGLLDMYHRQVHGSLPGKKGMDCPGDGLMDIKHNRFDRSMNPFKAFLSWPGKPRKTEKLKPVEEESYGHEMRSKYKAPEPIYENKMDRYLAQDDELDFEPNLGLDHEYAEHLSQEEELDMFDSFQPSKSKLINSPMMDYKREFASDEANPYVENLRQRYEPSPFAFSD
ncbi:uncharacterized protein LOC108022005 isoform X2 [Drosophila biarmipes]|uniref:uncharacterized protein LOC108022005 isoform X2 n=1 Tax=Drosophila biarmipes TaxID=125945 RepID=UPI0007E61B61|nr:uncharacterized protein LOC108022005 isoform X2 [Drosophila biarmipes]